MSSNPSEKFNLLDFSKANIRTLHLGWFAFFVSFMVWFAHAPLMPFIRESLQLTDLQAKLLLTLNIALTIPARIVVGMMVDRFGPRIMFAGILVLGGVISIFFAMAQDYQQLALTRLLAGMVGAGFVVGIRLIGEWFPARQTGIAQGIYGGWGNFGSAGSAWLLPIIATTIGAEFGWRAAIIITGIISIVYGLIYYWRVRNTPKGSTYFKPKKTGALEVTSGFDLVLYMIMNIPMYAALAMLAGKLAPGLISVEAVNVIDGILAATYLFQAWKIWELNKHILKEPVPELQRYSFAQVAILDLAYMVTFGTELAVVSMLPMFYVDMFGLDKVTAGLLAGSYAFINLVARPMGGLISDKFGRKITLLIVFIGIGASFMLLGQVSKEWSVLMVIAAATLGGIFSKAGSGAVYAMVPLIQRRLTGQIAGMAGAYGNVGGVVFLTVLASTNPQIFFMTIGGTALLVLAFVAVFLREPSGTMTEVLPDGTVQMIELK
ncbi:MFS transporter [Candidatus Thiothrix sp. Deng01]|uniref:MFS transporter n=1 Tax=Candidatus Thiothrix phosphatis TaxID=3112415 RepID=A0ABU6D0V1_9GAMM|nr:MFS transporter [Candidatus Thiothrix sp. Deng01]MEB4592476.1 MFS transporter [Candidatus Thiothrix sp. Deng01]